MHVLKIYSAITLKKKEKNEGMPRDFLRGLLLYPVLYVFEAGERGVTTDERINERHIESGCIYTQ